MSEGFIKSGIHLGAARSWIQRKFHNGSLVTWGSNDRLGEVTVTDIEHVAQEISNAVGREAAKTIERLVEMIDTTNVDNQFRMLGLLKSLENVGIMVKYERGNYKSTP